MQRNRRIGTSMSGIANFADRNGLPMLRDWQDQGYHEVERLDKVYSEWLCVRESIKTTTVKPSGTVSILAGESPGVHWAPGGEFFYRLVRFGKDDPIVAKYTEANYRIEPAVENPDTTVVIYFPIRSLAKRSESDVTLFEKAALAASTQEWWSDNSVSVTLSFDPEKEAEHVGAVLGMYEGKLKTVSFLPMLADGAYKQMPYTKIDEAEYNRNIDELFEVDLTSIYAGNAVDAAGEAFCTTDYCEVKVITENQ
jgi:ribonucleoside-triphosphate reductase